MKKEHLEKGLEIAIELATWSDNSELEITDVIAVLMRVFCFRTVDQINLAKAGQPVGDIQEKVFELGKKNRQKCRAAVGINTQIEVYQSDESKNILKPDSDTSTSKSKSLNLTVEVTVKKRVHCKGRMPKTHELCNQFLYLTDGEFLYDANGSIFNKGRGKQKIDCSRCGKISSWNRSPKFINSVNN